MASFWAIWIRRVADPVTLTTWFVISALMAFAGPFNTFGTLSFPTRLLFWSCLIGAAIVVALGVCEAVKHLTGDARTLTRDLKVSVLFAGLYGPATWVLIDWLAEPQNDLSFPLWRTTLYVFLITAAVMVLRRIIGVGDEPVAEPPPLIRRLDGIAAKEIARLSVRDHYVEVHTTTGVTKTLLMRFSDALAELKGIDGFRVHRSHWVARKAVERVERENGRLFLVTCDKARVPVSRGFRAKIVNRELT